MNEHILAAIVRLDEAISLLTIVPFHGSGWHQSSSCFRREVPKMRTIRNAGARYFFAPEPLPGFSFTIFVAPAAGLGFSAFGFFGSRWPLGMITSWFSGQMISRGPGSF